QRKGLGLANGPWHVIALDGATARVVVAHPEDAMIRHVEVGDVSWLRELDEGEQLTAKLRYQMQPADCRLDASEPGTLNLAFDAPQKPTAPGQVAALYAGEELVAGGIVMAAH
ncbi:MAG: aminomethyltransferase beta-barrel domain-containing protein, partial [Mariprofundaceae bacterium]